jgi:hypothetical protein
MWPDAKVDAINVVNGVKQATRLLLIVAISNPSQQKVTPTTTRVRLSHA